MGVKEEFMNDLSVTYCMVVSSLCTLVLYLLVAFVRWDILWIATLDTWEMSSRFFLLIMGTALSFMLSASVLYVLNDSK